MERTKCSFTRATFGDIIACLPAIRTMGGGMLVIGHIHGVGFGRESMKGERFESLRPLLMEQDYITDVAWGSKPKNAIDFSSFRIGQQEHSKLLALRQAEYAGLSSLDLSPWLKVRNPIPSPVIFARSGRYLNPRFNWFEYRRRYPDAIFVGLKSEHEAFEKFIETTIEHRPTENLLELARIIAGAPRFLGNQSCPWWIAAGLGIPAVQETDPNPNNQNSVIERPDYFYIGDEASAHKPNWR